MKDYIGLKKSNCKNCYKCIRYCPVKSIRFSSDQAQIVNDECILCGHCFVVCPQNAKVIRSDVEIAKQLIAENEKVIVSLAPSFQANFAGAGLASLKKALIALGFSDVEETAIGATIVKKQYEKLIEQKSSDVIISSCCHTVNLLIRKYYPEALPSLAKIESPMSAHCRDIKARFPDAKTVFIGPCISKKAEADEYVGNVDCVLTFEELSDWMSGESVELDTVDGTLDDNTRARLFPTSGGILRTMDRSSDVYSYLVVDGLENCKLALKEISEHKLTRCFIEMSACAGSCIGGPALDRGREAPVSDYIFIDRFAGKHDYTVSDYTQEQLAREHSYVGIHDLVPTKDEVLDILKQMGKNSPDDELNCGTCGYDTCREKAVAVFNGKANLQMCLPFLKEKAESFSDNIINNTPNGIIVLNENLEVQQINSAARSIMKIANASDVLGEQVVRILDPTIFLNVLESGHSVPNKQVYLAEYARYVEQSVLYDREYHILICIMRDVTDEQVQHRGRVEASRRTVEITDRVIDKQMRIAQEIASLLGETTAETKVALTKLKESLKDE